MRIKRSFVNFAGGAATLLSSAFLMPGQAAYASNTAPSECNPPESHSSQEAYDDYVTTCLEALGITQGSLSKNPEVDTSDHLILTGRVSSSDPSHWKQYAKALSNHGYTMIERGWRFPSNAFKRGTEIGTPLAHMARMNSHLLPLNDNMAITSSTLITGTLKGTQSLSLGPIVVDKFVRSGWRKSKPLLQLALLMDRCAEFGIAMKDAAGNWIEGCAPPQFQAPFSSPREEAVEVISALLPPPPATHIATVYFGHDLFNLEDDDRLALDNLARSILSEYQEGGFVAVVVAGTDRSGTVRYNDRLSKDRGDAVRHYLISQGVPADAFIVQENCGERAPGLLPRPTADDTRVPENRLAKVYAFGLNLKDRVERAVCSFASGFPKDVSTKEFVSAPNPTPGDVGYPEPEPVNGAVTPARMGTGPSPRPKPVTEVPSPPPAAVAANNSPAQPEIVNNGDGTVSVIIEYNPQSSALTGFQRAVIDGAIITSIEGDENPHLRFVFASGASPHSAGRIQDINSVSRRWGLPEGNAAITVCADNGNNNPDVMRVVASSMPLVGKPNCSF